MLARSIEDDHERLLALASIDGENSTFMVLCDVGVRSPQLLEMVAVGVHPSYVSDENHLINVEATKAYCSLAGTDNHGVVFQLLLRLVEEFLQLWKDFPEEVLNMLIDRD